MIIHMAQKSGQNFLLFCHNARVWQADRQTDGQTDSFLVASPRWHSVKRGKTHELRSMCGVISGVGVGILAYLLVEGTDVWRGGTTGRPVAAADWCRPGDCLTSQCRRRRHTGIRRRRIVDRVRTVTWRTSGFVTSLTKDTWTCTSAQASN